MHVHDEPALRARQGTAPHGGDEAGSDQGGLAAARGPHHGKEPEPGAAIGEAAHELGHERLAAEEVGGVGLEEGPEALVRVAGLGRGDRDRTATRRERLPQGEGDVSDFGVALRRGLRRGPGDDLLEGGRQFRPDGADGWDRLAEMLLDDLGRRGPGERVATASAS